IQQVSLRKLGKALNVDPTAVYRYFPNKEALVTAMVERIMHTCLPDDEQMEGDWRVRLTALAQRAHNVFSTYPALTIHLPSSPYIRTPAGDRLIEIGYQALRDAGLSDENVILFHELLYTLMLGVGQIEAQFGEDLEDERKATREHVATLSAIDFPNLHRLVAIMVPDNDVVFQFVLELYLNAIESYTSGSPG
ncbi:MAG: TetR/AcrR family transcriptional regulator, partial [Chloroflexota bacterium]